MSGALVSYSLNIKRQISDAVNEEEFEIATDKPTKRVVVGP